ncbi:MAG: type I restriction endonuclease subunit R [Anaerolineae bacterium]
MSLSFREELISQIPALHLLMALGYTYLTPEEALELRGNSERQVLLEGVLAPWLREHNAIEGAGRHAGERVPFSEGNIQAAIRRLRDEPMANGLIAANERVYELLTLGTSLAQTLGDDTRSYTLHYIDWQHPERNVYHVSDEFPVQRAGRHDTRRPDIVLFVNGIPLAVVECKRPDLTVGDKKAVQQGISQMLRNQGRDEIPGLFLYPQLLLALSVNEARYATTGAGADYWATWSEQAVDGAGNSRPVDLDPLVAPLINRPLDPDTRERLFGWREHGAAVRTHFESLGDRLPTPQDRALYALLRPERLLTLAYRFIVFDAGIKKIARYQQYFAVCQTAERVARLDYTQTRTGGVIWQTTGSGKSLTMVWLAKALALHPAIQNPRVVIVTDRINLDDQITRTFRHCGKTVAQATSGRHLASLVRTGRADIITTVIDKFDTAAEVDVRDTDYNTFVLVDESHRSQYGTAHARMRQVLRHACYIGFTGTPLLKAEKSTAARFGGFIHKYTMRQAVEDGTVVPLIYEGRLAELAVDQRAIDAWFERVTRDLTEEQKLDLKRKYSRADAIQETDRRIKMVAFDISEHYRRAWQGTGFKAQLATSSKAAALRYKAYLDGFDTVRSEVVISAPDTREGHEEVDAEVPEVQAFWQRMMERYGSEQRYNREIIADFGREHGVELLIVVDKLLVGFDEPRNAVLYLDKDLREHGLLQAIARVNRVFKGKQFGYIVDYRGILGELNQAIETYDALEGYDAEDLDGTVTDVSEEIRRLPQLHSALWAIFAPVPNRQDIEALQRYLAPEDLRDRFYAALTEFAQALKVALGSMRFFDEVPQERIEAYKRDLAFFHNLRAAVRQRYNETVDYGAYEARVRKLLDEHITSYEVSVLTEGVDIFSGAAFDAAVARLGTSAAQADMIASHVKTAVAANMERDPALYRRFSQMIQETIDAFRQLRIDEREYLKRAREILQEVRSGQRAGIPARLGAHRDAPAYYGLLTDALKERQRASGDLPGRAAEAAVADAAIALEEIIDAHRRVDWAANHDLQKQIKLAMDDPLYALLDNLGVTLSDAQLDMLEEQVIEVARHRDSA